MPDTIIESALSGKLDNVLLKKWLNNECIEDAPDDCLLLCCTKSEFVAYFLTYLRNQTDNILQTNSNAVQILQNATPEKLLSTARKHRRSISEPTSEERNDSLSVKTDCKSHHESPNREKKRTGRRVKTKLFTDDKNNSTISSDESRLSCGIDRIVISSTPIKNGLKPSEAPTTSPVISRFSHERCDTPRLSQRHSRSHEKSCLGDFLVTATKSSKKKTKKNSSNDNEVERIDLDISSSEMFPEIGARKSTSLRSEKKRIKPTNIDKSQKSISLNSFNSDCFQHPPLALEENSAFKQHSIQPLESANTFEAERSMLKQERHKLMEKFNILNTSTPIKSTAMPQIKITQKESFEVSQTYVKADVTKILMKDQIDYLIEIYELLLSNNLILSVNTEIYFLISILVSKQLEEDYLNVECKLNEGNKDFLLKSIHNSTYFAVKSLWNQKAVLEIILDKNSLKTLGENKKVRAFSPELAKFLLNWYCVRCEKPSGGEGPRPAAVVAYNCETDNAENFPTTHAFHLFKKQRDAFYDIIRWYQESGSAGGTRTSFRARVKTLLSHGATAANHAHLAALFVAHMLASCLPSDAQESKLSKLQRRFTCPTSTESNRLPHFTSSEMFYKEFISYAENESFRVHLRDAFSTELIALDSTHIAMEDRGNSNNITREYLEMAKKLALLAKFLGYLTSLPYSQVPAEIMSKTSNNVNHVVNYSRELNYIAPKEKVLENNIGLRNYSQPTIDLISLLKNAYDNSRLSITIPWLVHYLSMLDYTTLRLKYYSQLIKTIFDIYYNKLKLTQIDIKKNTIIYLKSILGWLFDLEHFPSDDNRFCLIEVTNSDGVDTCDLVDESTILELCPCLKEINTLLSTCRLSQEQKGIGSFRHITPVSLTVNPEDRIKNKEKELQSRLEEELLKSQPASTRRVFEMVVERVASRAVKELSARELVAAREHARQHARRMLAACRGEGMAVLLQKTTAIYTAELSKLRTEALASHRAPLAGRTRAALAALVPGAARELQAAAARASYRALHNWLRDHTASVAILCKDIEAEMRSLISMNEMQIPAASETANADVLAAPSDVFIEHSSVATTLIELKEHLCQVLEGEVPGALPPLLSHCESCVAPHNVFCRPPARKAIMQLTVDLCLVYVSRKPKEITEAFLNNFHNIWNICCPDRKHNSAEEILLPERRDISPQLRNFDDDERMATPVSDEEDNTNVNAEPIASTSQPITPNWQPIKSKLQPIIIKCQPLNTRSQPASPMLQPLNTKWQYTSKSQPVSPKLYPSSPQPIILKWQPIAPKLQVVPSKSQSESEVKDKKDCVDSEFLECFDRILCPRNTVLFSDTCCDKSEVWKALATVLVFLLKHDFLSEDSLTEQCLSVYRQDWPQSILESLSACMKSVSSRWSRSSTGKFTLFLDFLAEYCGDMDYEPVE